MPTTTFTPSWPAKKLLLALPFAFLFFSCEEPTDIGLDVQPDSQVGVHFYDASPIETKTVLLDSTVTTGSNSLTTHLAGYLDDPVFGKVTAKTFSELRLRDAGFEVGANPQEISVTLQLNLTAAYGEKTEPVSFGIYRLTENISNDPKYNFSSVPYEADSVGTLTFTPSEKNFNNDNRVFVTAGLSEQFGRAILEAGTEAFTDHDKFREVIKGIAIVPVNTDRNRSVVNFAFDRDADSSFVRIDYKVGTEAKVLKLFLDRSSRRFHSITSDRSGSGISGLVNNGDVISSEGVGSFIQAGIGVRTVLKFPDLENLTDQLGTEIAVNDARLIIPVVGSDTALFVPPTTLVMAEASGNRVYQPGGNIKFIGTDARPDGLQPVTYSRRKGQYSAQLGHYLQTMLYGKRENRGIVLYSFSNAVQVNRVQLPEPGPNGIKLRIYYTKVE